MNKETFQRLQRELKPQLSFLNACMDVTINLALMVLFVLLVSNDSLAGFIFSQIVLGILITRSLFLMHESAHGVLSHHKLFNNAAGYFFGIFCFLPFPAWRFLHLKHHTFAGVREVDPLLVISVNKKSGPILGFIRKCLLVLWKIGFPFVELIRSVGYMLSPLIIYKKTSDRSLITKSFLSALIIVGFWIGGHALWPEIIQLKTILPGVFIYLMLNELVSLPQHLELPSVDKSFGSFPLWQHSIVTRSVLFPKHIARHLLLNFNLHTEHHVFPMLPWRQLPDARERLKEVLGTDYQQASWTWSLHKRQGPFSLLLELKDLPSEFKV